MSQYKFSQKYAVTHFLNELPDSFEFSFNNWPSHITLADVFAIPITEYKLIENLKKFTASKAQIKTKVIGSDMFGSEKDIQVRLFENTPEIKAIHRLLIDELRGLGAIFNNPEFTLDGFKPHSTVKKFDQLKLGSSVCIDSISLVDFFPKNDPYQRKIVKTIPLLRK